MFRNARSAASRVVDLKRNYKNEGSRDDGSDLYNLQQQRREATQFGILGMAMKSRTQPTVPVSNVHELRKAILDDRYSLSQVELTSQLEAAVQNQVDEVLLQNHAVLQLMKERFESGSKPGHRQDNATLALAIEGGGMRGCVSAGMAAAIASLGLTDTIDRVYGSSAGSVVGSYMISRQMCVDVYVDILPAAKKRFVCKRRLVSGLAKSAVDVLKSAIRFKTSTAAFSSAEETHGMNISFVLDSIMGQDHGIRPLDLETFEENNAHQQLRIVSSCLDENGQLATKCFGTTDFYGDTIARRPDGRREGLFACLQASMTVPAATGPPVELTWTKQRQDGTEDGSMMLPCFDAFCFQPIPYRSAVEEGATHVMALASRPLGFQPKTKQGVYETTLAPLYFYSHGHAKVAKFFENGGQQYLYAEDLLTLQEAKEKLQEPVLVPPTQILYGLDDEKSPLPSHLSRQRDDLWKKAHMLPVQVPPGTPELGTLEQSKDPVLGAVRGGFSAAFDLLAPIVGLESGDIISGKEVAKLVFPDFDSDQSDWLSKRELEKLLLETKVNVPGEAILDENNKILDDDTLFSGMSALSASQPAGLDLTPSHILLSQLPGFQGGKLHHLSKGLRYGSSIRLNKHLESSQRKDIAAL